MPYVSQIDLLVALTNAAPGSSEQLTVKCILLRVAKRFKESGIHERYVTLLEGESLEALSSVGVYIHND